MKKIIATLLIGCLVMSTTPTYASAEETPEDISVTEVSVAEESATEELTTNSTEETVPEEIPVITQEVQEAVTQETVTQEIVNEAQDTATEEPPLSTLLQENTPTPTETPVPIPDIDEPTSSLENTASYVSESSVQFSTVIAPTIVDVTIPLNVDIYINPNEADGFLYGAIEVQNHTLAPVVISIKDFHTETIPFSTCIAPGELPYPLNWDNMSVSQTEQFFSLGIMPIYYNNMPWEEEYVYDYVYATSHFSQTPLGVVSGGKSAYLGLRSYYGKAFTHEKRFQFSATFVVELK